MKRTIGLISVVAIAMALTLTIAFSGVAVASPPVPPTKETEIIGITTTIECSGTVIESQRLSLEIDSVDLINNTPLEDDEKYGKIGYDEKMIGSSGNTEFCKEFKVDTGTAPNLYVHKDIGYTQGALGSLSHHEQVGMKVIAAGKPGSTGTCTDRGSVNHSEWKRDVCPFKYPCTPSSSSTIPGSCEEVHVYSEMVVTNVEATTDTAVMITGDPGVPVGLTYEIKAAGDGLVVAGVDLSVEDGRGAATLGSRLMYKEKSIGYGNVTFHKKIGYASILPKP